MTLTKSLGEWLCKWRHSYSMPAELVSAALSHQHLSILGCSSHHMVRGLLCLICHKIKACSYACSKTLCAFYATAFPALRLFPLYLWFCLDWGQIRNEQLKRYGTWRVVTGWTTSLPQGIQHNILVADEIWDRTGLLQVLSYILNEKWTCIFSFCSRTKERLHAVTFNRFADNVKKQT